MSDGTPIVTTVYPWYAPAGHKPGQPDPDPTHHIIITLKEYKACGDMCLDPFTIYVMHGRTLCTFKITKAGAALIPILPKPDRKLDPLRHAAFPEDYA